MTGRAGQPFPRVFGGDLAVGHYKLFGPDSDDQGGVLHHTFDWAAVKIHLLSLTPLIAVAGALPADFVDGDFV